ncbi:unnamed protein product [Ectocarpus sp. 6 AP-2014]
MLSVKRDVALKGVPPSGQPFPKDAKKLGVDVCLLPPHGSEEGEDNELVDGLPTAEDVAAATAVSNALLGDVINGGDVASEGGGGDGVAAAAATTASSEQP